MCGIVGYTGPRAAAALLLDGLRRLEYRGYDSAGIATLNQGEFHVVRASGKLERLSEQLGGHPPPGAPGIGHTRWATHGAPTVENAHPHRVGDVVLVHNGIIENYLELKQELSAAGRRFESETDTEILAHLIDRELQRGTADLGQAVRAALKLVRGAYALAIMSRRHPDTIVAAKNASPLVIGYGAGENFLASDIPALLQHTRRVSFLEEGDVAVLTPRAVTITTLDGRPVARPERVITWTPAMAEKDGHKHFMHKEIHEQPRAVIDTLRGRLRPEEGDAFLEGLDALAPEINSCRRLLILACGTSYHAGLIGKFLFEQLARLPVEVDLASEYRYRDALPEEGTLALAISQSGETADTLGAMKVARERGARLIAICNVVDASVARLAEAPFYTHAGPEIGVASTKAFTTQIAAELLLAVAFGRRRGALSQEQARAAAHAILAVPGQMEAILRREEDVRRLAQTYMHAKNFLYLGRGINYPIALEGALKLKEISYIHAEGYPAGEMKHGPIALIDEQMPVVVIATRNGAYEKTAGNIQEVKARGGKLIALVTEGDRETEQFCDATFAIPACPAICEPLLTALPLQLLAYHIADLNGTDVDQPRNLAKSVTVE